MQETKFYFVQASICVYAIVWHLTATTMENADIEQVVHDR